MGDYGQYIVPTVDVEVNFKVGQPAPSMLPLDKIRKAAADKFSQTDPMLLQYGHIYGYPKFRASLAKFLTRRYEAEVDPEKLMVTNGNTGAITLICSLFTKAGDLVFAEEPTYFLAKSIFNDFNLNCVQIPMDEHGVDVELLEKKLESGQVPKMMYVVTTCHNPTGRTLIAERRAKLAELSNKYQFYLVCDEVYQLLAFPGVEVPPPMFTYDKHGTILGLGSFSKILAPALRVGWIQAHESVLKKIAGCGQLDSSGGLNPVSFGIVHSAIDLGLQDEHLDETTGILAKRYKVLESALVEFMPLGVTFERPQGGYFVLVSLPQGQKAADLLDIAVANKVRFLPGTSFGESMQNRLRLSFSFYDPEDLRVGAERLGKAINEFWASIGYTHSA